MEFAIELKRTQHLTVMVTAKNSEEAIAKALAAYENGEFPDHEWESNEGFPKAETIF